MRKNEKVLSVLKEFLIKIPSTSKVYIFGGLAVDGHRGKITRDHDDIDLICWRKDVKTVQKIIRKMGYGIKTSHHPENPKLVYSFVSTDKKNLITFQIIDKKPNNSFEINFWHFPHQILPTKLLGPAYLTLEKTTFPAVTTKLLYKFNKNAGKYFKKIKKTNPKLYNELGYKLDNYFHDLKIIKKLASTR